MLWLKPNQHVFVLRTNPSLYSHFASLNMREGFARLAARKLEIEVILSGMSMSVASVYGLSPVTSSAQADSTSELLRFL